MAILFHSGDILPPKIPRTKIKNLIKEILLLSNLKTGNINYIFCTDNYLLQINKEYLNHNDFTDIITFPYPEGKTISADIFISVERIKENASKFNETLLRETCRVIFHGALHLSGLNDHSEKEKTQMRKAEDLWLSKLDL